MRHYLAVVAALAGWAAAEDWPDPRPEDMWLGQPADVQPSPPVVLADGTVTGTVMAIGSNRTTFGFRGIPFGESPVGSLRFMPPRKNKPYGALNATRLPVACPQPGLLGPGSENCLFINVYTTKLPNATHNPRMPVMVFIYGGAFVMGGSVLYFPTRLQRNTDLVFVTPHYRLGVLGFFSTMTDEAPGNQGLMDQLLALQWVQDNIEAFGGDPTQVTLFGESAGATSVSLLLVSPLAEGLFHGAITESGSSLVDWAYNTEPLTTARKITELAHCSFDDPVNKLLECMRNVSAAELVTIGSEFEKSERKVGRNGFDGLNPVIQPSSLTVPRVLPRDPLSALQDGAYLKIPTIHGCNRNEGSFVFGMMYNGYLKINNLTNDTNFLKNDIVDKMLTSFHINDPTGGVQMFATDHFFFYVDTWDMDTMNPGLQDLTGLFGIKGGTSNVASLLAAGGQPTWLYSFQYRGQEQHTMARFFFRGSNKLPFDMGVTHANELIYLFPIPLMMALNEEEQAVSDEMVQMWTNFVIYGDPTPPGSNLTRWPPLTDGDDPPYLDIASTSTVKHNFAQTFDITVQQYLNATATTPAPSTSSAPPATTTVESPCRGQVDSLTRERDTYRGATIGLAVAAVLVVAVAVGGVVWSRRRRPDRVATNITL